MRTVSKRELNQNTASVLDQVTPDEDVVVTERGIPRWQVTTFDGPRAPLARLEQDGRYTPPSSAPAPWPDHPGGRAYNDDEVEELLDSMRGDR